MKTISEEDVDERHLLLFYFQDVGACLRWVGRVGRILRSRWTWWRGCNLKGDDSNPCLLQRKDKGRHDTLGRNICSIFLDGFLYIKPCSEKVDTSGTDISGSSMEYVFLFPFFPSVRTFQGSTRFALYDYSHPAQVRAI